MNPAQMVRALNIPAAKVAKHDLDSAEQRVVTLKELLDNELPDMETIKAAMIKGLTQGLGIEAEPGEITEAEESLARQFLDEEIGTEEFVREIDNPGGSDQLLEGTHTGPGGTINAYAKLEGPTLGRLQRVLITGDFFVTPPRVVFDLEAALAGARIQEVDAIVKRFFEETAIEMLSVGPEDFTAAINSALANREAGH
jgi:lipoate-protein ligase A